MACADEVAAYCFDRAVHAFGRALENAIEEAADGKKKPQAEAAAQNVVAIWTGAELKFASPSPTR